MKKLLFVMTSLRTGGITSSLVNLLNIISKDEQLSIDVLLFDADLKSKLPQNVNVLKENKFLKIIAAPQSEINKLNPFLGAFRLLMGVVTKILGNSFAYKIIFLFTKRLEEYDVAISCTQSAPLKSLYGGCNEFVLDKVKAKKKLSFLHCDYKNYGINTPYSLSIYSRFDIIAAVSNGVKDVFLKEAPALSDKVFIVHNCHNFNQMKELSLLDTEIYDKSRINLLTVARIAKEKGHLRMLNVLSRLSKEGYDFSWHIVGSGSKKTEESFKKLIEEKNLLNNIIMYEDTLNPYKYFPHADILVVPSYHEAAPIVYTEAEFFSIPVITTNTTSANEFIKDKNAGIVCSNDEDGLYEALKNILDNKSVLEEIKLNISAKKLSNDIAINEFYQLIK